MCHNQLAERVDDGLTAPVRIRGAHQWLNYPPNWFLLAAAAYPFLWLNTFALFVLRARVMLGRWPAYGNPDPSTLNMEVHRAVVMWGMIFVFAIGITGIIAAIAARLASKRVPWMLVLLNIISPVLTIVCVRLEPWGFGDWFID